MKVRSARFGEFEVGEEAVIHFPAGFAPFGKELDFVLLAAAEVEGGGDSEASFGRPLRRHTPKATAVQALLAPMDGIDWRNAARSTGVSFGSETPRQTGCLSSNRLRQRQEQRRQAERDEIGPEERAGPLEGQVIAWLQSLQMPQLGFWVGHAGKLFPERDIGIEAHHLQSVDVEHVEQLCIVLILTIEQEQVTANLLAPVVVNMEAGIGRQVVVAGSIEQVRVPVPTSRVAAEAV